MEVLAEFDPVDHRVPSLLGPFDPIGVVVHHTGSLNVHAALPSLGTCRKGRPDLRGPLCNVLIGRDASVNVITDGRANDTGTGDPHVFEAFKAHRPLPAPVDDDPKKKPNGHFMGGSRFFYDVEVENTGKGEPYPDAVVAITIKVVAAICKANGFAADRVILHREWTRRKIDWSFDGDTRAVVARELEGFLMALSDQEQQELLERVRAMHRGNWVRRVRGRQEGDLTWLEQKVREVVRSELGGLSGVDVDELAQRIADRINAPT